jgi:MoaA/NifB/PqqE/SkfB family radical SAM enzyme
LSLLGQLRECGTQQISFSGGEPLLRDDIGTIIDYCRNLGIMPTMNSRGAMIDKKISEIKNLCHLKVSIDGPENIHDTMAGRKGSFRQAVRTIEIAKNKGIKVTLATTLTRYNIDHLDFILGMAEQYDTVVAFQPLKKLYRGVTEMAGLYPEKDIYRKRIAALINLKKKGNKHMRNSLIGLEYISHWPDYHPMECAAGKLFCIIDTNGDLYPCDRVHYKEALYNCLELGFKKAFDSSPLPLCNGCGFCGSLELSFMLSLKLGTMKSVWDIIR